MREKQNSDMASIANTYYEPGTENMTGDLSSGLAMIHEQINNAYADGEIDRLAKAGGNEKKLTH